MSGTYPYQFRGMLLTQAYLGPAVKVGSPTRLGLANE